MPEWTRFQNETPPEIEEIMKEIDEKGFENVGVKIFNDRVHDNFFHGLYGDSAGGPWPHVHYEGVYLGHGDERERIAWGLTLMDAPNRLIYARVINRLGIRSIWHTPAEILRERGEKWLIEYTKENK